MGRESGDNGSRDPVARGASWVEKNLGRGWVEVEPGIYEFLLNEARAQTGPPSTSAGEEKSGKISRTTTV